MSIPQMFDVLTVQAKMQLIKAAPIGRLQAQLGGVNRESEGKDRDVPTEKEVAVLRSNLQRAIDELEESMSVVLSERREDEIRVKRWTLFVGAFLVLLIVLSIVLQIIGNSATTWTFFSGLSMTGLLFVLYSPVQRIMAIANDRVALQLIPIAFRIRAVVASSGDELARIGTELSEALLRIENDANRRLRLPRWFRMLRDYFPFG
jgi:hypothetical protein